MGRQRGSLELPGNIEPQTNQPLDAQRRVDSKADLTNAATFPRYWEGMDVYVIAEKQWYYLKALPLTNVNNWEPFAKGAGVTVDDAMSDTSENPVQNKVIKEAIDDLDTRLTAAEGKHFVAEYNVTTSQELLAYLASTNEPFAPIVVKRGNDYYTSILAAPSGDSAIVRVIGSGSGDFHIFTYTVTDAVWANSGHTLQKKLVSGTDIKTINSESLLGAGDIEITPFDDVSKDKLDNLVDIKSIGSGLVYDDTTGELSATATGGWVTTADINVSNAIGRYNIGDNIPAGTALEEINRKMLEKLSVPTLTDPSATLTFTAPTLAKVGSTVSGGNATVALNRGSISPAYGTSGYRSGEATGYAISMTGAASAYSDSNATGQFTVPDFTRATPGKVTITGTASYAAGEQPKDSDGNNYGSPLAAGSKSATKEIEFINAFYYGGTAEGATRTDLTGLMEDLTKKGTKTYTVTTDGTRVTFAYDSSYGNLTRIEDPNGFDNLGGFEKTTITVDGQTYNLYVSRYPTYATMSYKLFF